MTARFVFVALVGAAALHAQQDTALTKQELLSMDRKLAVRNADGTDLRLLEFSDSNAAILIPGQPILRAADAQKVFHDRYFGKYDWRPVTAIASADGNLGCAIGFSTLMERTGTLPAVVRKGSYVSCWRRVQGAASRQLRAGEWRLVALQRSDSPREAPAFWSSKQLPTKTAPASSFLIYGNGVEQLTAAIGADSAFAHEAEKPEGPGRAFSHWAAEDAWLLGAPQPTLGKAKILAAFEGYPADRVLLWDPMREFGYASGGLAVTVGHARTRLRDAVGINGADTNPQKYLTVWRMNPDHSWSWIVDLGSPR